MNPRVPFREGLFKEENGEGALLASKCRSCGQVFFPARSACLDCFKEDMDKITLSKTGKLYSFTIVHMPAEHFQPPYAIGWIELPEGVRVFSQIRGWQEQPLEVGVDMRLSIEKLWEVEEKEMTGYVFRPFPSGVDNRDRRL